jgi:hypothetical protein
MVRLAFKRAQYSGLTGRLIDLLSGGDGFCHVELIFSDGLSFSSTTMDGKPEGVRFKQINYSHPERWDIIDLPQITPELEAKGRAYAETLVGQPYDRFGVARFVLPFMRQHATAWFCNEVVIDVGHVMEQWLGVVAWEIGPNVFRRIVKAEQAVYEMATKQQ